MSRFQETWSGDTLFSEKTAKQLTRRTDPGTSFQAASQVVGKLKEIQKRVLAELKSAMPEGLTDLELEERCGSHGSTFRTRRSELVELGMVADSGRKKNQNGRNRIVWVVT